MKMVRIKELLFWGWVSVSITLLIGLPFFLGMQIGQSQKAEIVSPDLYEQYNDSAKVELLAEVCGKEPDIEAKAKCLNYFVVPIFKYKIRNESEDISYQTLFEEGGDCGIWANFYVEVGKMMGVYSERVIISVNNETTHAFAVLSNHQGYCTLDQTDIHCFKYGMDFEDTGD
jgi:hypothetical protein